MADRTISIPKLIRLLEERRERKALKLVESGSSYEDYLRGTGAFRENRALIQWLQSLIGPTPAKGAVTTEADDPADDDDDDDDDDDEDEETPVVVRRQKPRGWGGR